MNPTPPSRAVTIFSPEECDKMVVSEADILFYSNDGSIVERWSFENISHMCLFSMRQNKAEVKFIRGQKRELNFKTFYELQRFAQVMKSRGIHLITGTMIVQQPLCGQKVNEVVQKFETLGKKEPKLVLPPKATEQQAPPKQVMMPGPSSSSPPKVKEQLVKFSEPLVVRMAASPPPPPPKSSMVPKSILKVWRSITPKPKLAVTLTMAPKPILKKSEAVKIEDPKVEAPMAETAKPEPPKSDPPKPEIPKADRPKPMTTFKRRAPPPPAPKIETAPKPKPNVQIEVVEKKVIKSDLERLVDQLKQNDVKAMETAGFKVENLNCSSRYTPKYYP